MAKSLLQLKDFLKTKAPKKVITQVNRPLNSMKATTKLAAIFKVASIAGKIVKSQFTNPYFMLPVGLSAMSKDPKAIAHSAITNAGYKGLNFSLLQSAKKEGPFKNIPKINSIKQ